MERDTVAGTCTPPEYGGVPISSQGVCEHLAGKRHRWLGALLLLSFLAGCRPTVYELDEADLADPGVARAATLAQAGDVTGAIRLYNEVLTGQPALARAHFNVAMLYDAPGGDLVRALYHYQRYLELRPQTEKMAMIEDRIAAARENLAAAFGLGTAEWKQRVDILETENRELRASVETLNRTLQDQDTALAQARSTDASTPPAGTATRKPAEPPRPPSVPPPPQPPRDVRYVVQERDSLSSLAQRFYRDPRQWIRIYEANRNRIPNPNVLPVGASIVIPAVPSFDE